MESVKKIVTNNLTKLKGLGNRGSDNINLWQWIAVGAVGLLVLTQVFEISIQIRPRLWSGGTVGFSSTSREQSENNLQKSDLDLGGEVLPEEGIAIPVRWGDLGKKMIEAGVIDEEKFRAIYAERGGLPSDTEQLLSGSDTDSIIMTPQNSGVLLNLLIQNTAETRAVLLQPAAGRSQGEVQWIITANMNS